VTRIQGKSSCRRNCTKSVCWSKGDPIPSDYGTHHDAAAKFLAEEMPNQPVQLTATESTFPSVDELTRTGYGFLTQSRNFRKHALNV
jgi:hypothetical protein